MQDEVKITICPPGKAHGLNGQKPFKKKSNLKKLADKVLKKSKKQKKRWAKIERSKSDKFLSSYEWRKLRYQALKLYGAKCMCCGRSPADGAVMNVDHIKPRKTHPELALDIKNLQILCGTCNHGKGNWDDTDWREPDLAVLMGEKMAMDTTDWRVE